MMIINVDNKIKALQESLERITLFYTNEEITEEEYYSRIYPIEYELECLSDIL